MFLPKTIEAGSGIVDEIEDAGYAAVEEAIIASGESDDYAKCFVRMLQLQGTGGSILKPSNIFQPESILVTLENDFKLANFICKNGPFFAVLIFLLGFFFIICLCCACCKCLQWMCCCCTDQKPIQIILQDSAKNFMRGQQSEDRVEMIGKGSLSYA